MLDILLYPLYNITEVKIMNIRKLNVPDVSAQNKFDIITELLLTPQSTRRDVASASHLSSVTVGKVVCAMLEDGILVSSKLHNTRGRSTEILFPMPTLRALLILIRDTAFYASYIMLDGKEEQIIVRHRNESLDLEDDIRVFLAAVRIEIEAEKDIIGVYLVHSTKSPSKLGINIPLMLGLVPSLVSEFYDTLGMFFESAYPNDTALYIDIGDRVRYNLYAGGKALSQNAIGHTLEERNEYSVALEVSKRLSSLFEFVVPSVIAMSSDKITADKRFIDFVASELSKRGRIKESAMPRFIYDRDISLVGNVILQKSVEALAKELAGL